jgi:hypothetical protein
MQRRRWVEKQVTEKRCKKRDDDDVMVAVETRVVVDVVAVVPAKQHSSLTRMKYNDAYLYGRVSVDVVGRSKP